MPNDRKNGANRGQGTACKAVKMAGTKALMQGQVYWSLSEEQRAFRGEAPRSTGVWAGGCW